MDRSIRALFFFPLALLGFFAIAPVSAKVNFTNPDISADNRVLFRASSSARGAPDQNALFLARLPGTGEAISRVEQLSAFPEYLELIENGTTLQIRNTFGAVRIPASGGLPRQIPGLSAFVDGNHAIGGRTEDMAVSADGRWVVFLEAISAAYGRLILLDAASGKKTEVSPRVEKPDRIFPASWSPDSRFFVYERGERLYYYGVNSSPVDERFRLVGEGTINSIFWSREGTFYYFRGSSLFQIQELDLFTRALYVDFLELGKPAGRLPFEFDPVTDRFWISPDSSSIIIARNGRNIFYFPLDGTEIDWAGGASLPYLGISQSCLDIQVLWPGDGTITVLISTILPEETAGEKSSVLIAWRLDTGRESSFFLSLSDEGQSLFSGASLSPDGTKVLFWGEPGISIYDYASWKPVVALSSRRGYSGLWNSNSEVTIGNDQKIERVRFAAGSGASSMAVAGRDLLCLSQADAFGFESRNIPSPLILAQSGENLYSTDGSGPWLEILNAAMRNPSQSSAVYRVYLDDQGAEHYLNIPMVRNTSAVGTFPLIPGIRPQVTSRKDLVICFDLYDDDSGLIEVLDALDRFGFRATFFLGGEFIRRFPEAAIEIAERSHETASLFYAPINLSDSRYRITREFISQGLARNEDEFHRAAGRELALIWHPPYYASSSEIVSAAASAGYITVNRDLDPMDWVSRNDEIRLGLPHYSASDIIDRIMPGAKNGAIIPVRLGLLPGSRKDFLFDRINVLFDALVKEGYTVITVSQMLRQ